MSLNSLPESVSWPVSPELEDKIQSANAILAAIPGESPVPKHLAATIKGELDLLWDFSDEDCAFTGLCRVVERRGDDEESSIDYVEGEGKSNGLITVRFGTREKHWTTAFGFITKNLGDIGELQHQTQYYLHTAAPYTIQPGGELAAGPEQADDLYSVLSTMSDDFAYELSQQRFLRFPPKRQKDTIQDNLEWAEAECRRLGTDISDTPVALDAERAYVFTFKDGNWQYVPITLTDSVVGWANGLTVLGGRRLEEGNPIRKPKHLIDPKAGYCLRVDPYPQTAVELKIAHYQHLYIPISGQQVSARFGNEVTGQELNDVILRNR